MAMLLMNFFNKVGRENRLCGSQGIRGRRARWRTGDSCRSEEQRCGKSDEEQSAGICHIEMIEANQRKGKLDGIKRKQKLKGLFLVLGALLLKLDGGTA